MATHATAPSPQRRFLRRKAIWIAVAILAVLVIGLPMVALGRLQARILGLLTAELGRPVTAQSVHLVLLPWPGVELDQVRLADAPAFGGEALATAQSARATVRIWALLVGRLEFSSIHLEQANINLARDAAGNWNLAAMLAQVHRTGPRLRPTAAPASLRQTGRFPYLAIQDSRINFKFGLRKEPFYLAGVNASLSLARSGWRFHLQFSPQRSDLSLSNTGVVTADGIWFRSPPGGARRPSSYDIAAHLRGAYLAAASALLLGHDAGIHGVCRADLQIQGTARRFRITGIAQARQLRRWDQLPSNLRLTIPFAAAYDAPTDTVRLERLGNGSNFDLQGTIIRVLTRPAAALTLTTRQLPAAALLPLAHALDPGLPPDLTAQGLWNGRLQLSGGAGRRWEAQGHIAAAAVSLQEGQLRLRLTAPACRAVPGDGIACAARQARITGPDHARAALGLSAHLGRQGITLGLTGQRVTVADLAALGQLLGVAAPWPYQLSGAAQADFHRTLSWAAIRGYAAPANWQGHAFWRRASLRLPILPQPLPLQHLDLQVGPSPALAVRTEARLGGALWRLAIRRSAPSQPWNFAVGAGQVSLARLAAALRPQAPQGFLARLFSHPATWTGLLRLIHAQGRLAIAAIHWDGHAAMLETSIQADGPVWRFPAVRLRLAGGAINGRARYAHGALRFTGQGHDLQMQTLLAHTAYAQALRGRGRLDLHLTYPLAAGVDATVAQGELTLQPGAFPLLRTAAGQPLRFHRYQTRFSWRHSLVQLTRGRLWLTAASSPAPVIVQLQPPLPPRLDWLRPLRRTALVGAWPPPAPAPTPAPRDPHHGHPH